MQKRFRLIRRLIGFFFLTCATTTFWAYHAGYRLNFTPSVPMGVWKLEGLPRKGGYVLVEPSMVWWYRMGVERGYFAESMPLLKKMMAASGDVISYDLHARAITINGLVMSSSEIASKDSKGRPLAFIRFPVVLRKDEAWLSSEHVRGYDSRYFGPVAVNLLRGACLMDRFRYSENE